MTVWTNDDALFLLIRALLCNDSLFLPLILYVIIEELPHLFQASSCESWHFYSFKLKVKKQDN